MGGSNKLTGYKPCALGLRELGVCSLLVVTRYYLNGLRLNH